MTKTNSEHLGDTQIAITRLHLDLGNFRHEAVTSEAEAIAILCNKESVMALASDVVKRGELSPLDVLGVIPMQGNPGHFVAMEGNRRVCALIILNDPARAPEVFRQRLRQLAAQQKHPKKVKVHVFASRKEAKQWIDLRHLGEQDGVGTRPWDPTQKDRAAGVNAQPTRRDNALAVSILDRLTSLGFLSADQRSSVPVSTLTRYLSNPVVRAILGLHSARELIYSHKAEEVDRALLRFALDSITVGEDGTCPVNSRSRSEERTRYANSLNSEGVTPMTPLEAPSAPPRAKATNKKPSPEVVSGAARSARNPDKRTGLVPTNFNIRVKDSVLLRLRKEAVSLDVSEYPFSANYILRAMIERVMTMFLKKRGKWRDKIPDRELTSKCADELQEIGVAGAALTLVRKAGSNDDQPYSLHSLGHVLHGGSIPVPNTIKSNFDSWRPSLEAMLGFLEPSPK